MENDSEVWFDDEEGDELPVDEPVIDLTEDGDSDALEADVLVEGLVTAAASDSPDEETMAVRLMEIYEQVDPNDFPSLPEPEDD